MIELTLARRTDPETSHAAAERVKEFYLCHESIIYRYLFTYGPQTCHELAAKTGLTAVSVFRRMSGMEREGFVFKTQETRPSPTGRQCTVWDLA